MLRISGTTFQNNGGGTSSAIDTTGADLIVIAIACAHNQMNTVKVTISDSKGNTYNLGRNLKADGTNNCDISIVDCTNPTVGTGHTFTIGGGSQLQSMCIEAYARCNLGFDAQTTGGNSLASFTVQPGSITPNQNNSLVLMVGTAVQVAPTLTINQGFSQFTQNQPLVAGQTYGSLISDLLQGTAAAVNPTLTSSSNANGMAAITYVFKGSPEVTALALAGKGCSTGRGTGKFSVFALGLLGKGRAGGTGRARFSVFALPLFGKGKSGTRGKLGSSLTTALLGRGLAQSAGKAGRSLVLQLYGKGRAGGTGRLGGTMLLWTLSATGRAGSWGKATYNLLGDRVVAFTAYFWRRP